MFTPLSARDGDDSAPPEFHVSAHTIDRKENDEALDKAIAGAEEKILSRDDGRYELKSLDGEAFNARAESVEAAHDEKADFESCRDQREELKERIGAKSLKEALGVFSVYHQEFKKDPVRAGQILAASGLAGPVNGAAAFAKREPASDPLAKLDKDAHPAAKLGAILDAAIDGSPIKATDAEEFLDSAAARAELKKMFPGQKLSAITKNLVQIICNLQDDPLGTSARMAANYGAPVTAMQQQAWEQAQHASQQVGQAAGLIQHFAAQAQHFPHFDLLREDMAKVLSQPGFVSSGDAMTDLMNAYRYAELVSLEKQRSGDQAAALAKASKAVPVKSSGSAPRGGSLSGGSGLDGAISSALAGM